MIKIPTPVYQGDGGGAGGGGDGGGTPDPNGGKPKEPPADQGNGDGDGALPDGKPKPDAAGSFLAAADDMPDEGTAPPADFPDDWRDRMAGGDAELRKALDRYKSPADVAKANRDAQAKIRSGKLTTDDPMPDPEKEPEKAKEWRKQRGIPDDPSGYTVPDSVKGLVTDADKPRLTSFTEAMHQKGIPAQHVGPVMEWYFQEQAAAAEAIAEADKADKSEVEEALRSEWGVEFKAFSTLAKRFAEEVTPGINWFEARLPDGRLLGSVPDFVRALADLGRDHFGDVSLAGGEQTRQTMARKQELETMMRDEPDKYRADPKLSAEYEKIIDAELRAGGKSGGSRHSPVPSGAGAPAR